MAVGEEPSSRGPVRTLVEATPKGSAAARAWLTRPVAHTRDIRSEPPGQAGPAGPRRNQPGLLKVQHDQLQPIADALAGRLGAADGFERILLLWRYETISATIRFLDALSVIQD